MYTSKNTAAILTYLGYKPFTDFDATLDADTGLVVVEWHIEDPLLSDQDILDQEKNWAASVKTEEIYKEQEIRSANITTFASNKLGIKMPRAIVDLLEETWFEILEPAARKAPTEADSPTWYFLQQLRDDRNTLLTGLQGWVADPAKTAQDILDFDVEGWAGWSVDRP